jgi:hypothetical protein
MSEKADPTAALAALSAETFEALIEETLTLADDGDGRLALILGQVTRQPAARSRRDARTPFSLILHGPADRVARPGRYFLRHNSLPDLPPLLVTPIIDPEAPRDPEGRTMTSYQIAIN